MTSGLILTNYKSYMYIYKMYKSNNITEILDY